MTTRRLNRNEIAGIVGSDPRAIRAFERLLADVQANITGPTSVTLNYSSAGALTDPLPVAVTFQLAAEGGDNFTSGVSWGVTVLSGTFVGAAPTIGGTGMAVLLINSGLASPTATLGITARVGGRGYPPLSVTVSRSVASPDSGGGGGATDTTSSFTSFSTGTFAAITRDLSVTLPAAVTTATLTAAVLSLSVENDAPEGDTEVQFKWQRETAPSVWTDVGAVATSSPNPNVTEFFEPTQFIATPGSITCNRTETGMPAASAQKFRLVGRVSAGNVRSVFAFGTASVAA